MQQAQAIRIMGALLVVAVLGTGAWLGLPQDASGPPAAPVSRALASAADPAPAPAASMVIDGDAALVGAARQHGWPGSGAADDPIRIRDLELFLDGMDGLRIHRTHLHLVITDNQIEMTDGTGIRLEDATNVTVQQNRILGGTTGIVTDGGRAHRILANRVSGTETAILLVGGRGHLVAENVVTGHHHAVRIVDDPDRPAIAHHLRDNEVRSVRGGGDGWSAGMILAGRGHLATQNTFERAGHVALWLLDATDTAVRGNRFAGGTEALRVQGGTGTSVRGNSFHGHDGTIVTLMDATAARVRDNGFSGHTGLAMAAIRTQALTLEDNVFQSVQRGVRLDADDGGLVRANRFLDVERPVDLHDAHGTEVAANLMDRPTDAAIFLVGGDRIHLRANHIRDGAGHGIHANGTARLWANENVVERTANGITMYHGTDSLLERNVLRHGGGTGASFFAGSGRIANTSIESFQVGLHIENSSVTAQHLTVGYNGWGTFVTGRDGSAVRDSTYQGNEVALGAYRTGALDVAGNLVQDNRHGINLFETTAARMHGNRLIGNGVGLHLTDTVDTWVWDNLFDNAATKEQRDVRLVGSTDTRWNLTKRPGENVLGGAWIGGNAWHDYHGVDGDLDGLGDTPYVPSVCRDPAADMRCARDLSAFPLDLQPLIALPLPDRVPGRAPQPVLGPVTPSLLTR